jgi:hypothetical protein
MLLGNNKIVGYNILNSKLYNLTAGSYSILLLAYDFKTDQKYICIKVVSGLTLGRMSWE